MDNGGRTRTPESRLDLLEWRAAVTDGEVQTLNKTIESWRHETNARFSRLLFALWSLFAAIMGGATATIIATVVLSRHS